MCGHDACSSSLYLCQSLGAKSNATPKRIAEGFYFTCIKKPPYSLLSTKV